MRNAMKKILLGCFFIGVGTLLATGFLACDRSPDKGDRPASEAAKASGYTCPMHSDYHSDEPGSCPVCGMNLVPVEAPEAGPEGAATAPGAVTVSPAMQRFIGVRTVSAERRPLARSIRTVGKVEYDERRLYHVHTKIEGWIQDLYVNVTGEPVRKGQPLFSMYSPSLLATQEEYLIALRGRELLKDATTPEARRSGQVMADAARRRLQLWDVGDREIRRLEKGGKPGDRLTFYSHYDGVVIDKKAVEGLHVTPGADLMTIADLSVVWIYADVYEYELPYVKEGQAARVSLSYLPGKAFEGKVVYVYPYLEEATRTGRVRIELENPDGVLKPMMFADVFLESDLGEAIMLPESAIMDSGMRKLVYVDRGEGRFEPREVKVGRGADGYFEVLEGVSAGERVATAANFMIDAESKLLEARDDTPGGGGMAGHQHGAPEESR